MIMMEKYGILLHDLITIPNLKSKWGNAPKPLGDGSKKGLQWMWRALSLRVH